MIEQVKEKKNFNKTNHQTCFNENLSVKSKLISKQINYCSLIQSWFNWIKSKDSLLIKIEKFDLLSVAPPSVALIRGQNPGPDLIDGPTDDTPVTKISFRQFSPVSWVHRWPPTHQSHGNELETHWVHDEYELQS